MGRWDTDLYLERGVKFAECLFMIYMKRFITESRELFRRFFRNRAFWWGACLPLLPAVFSIPLISYAGQAAFSSWCLWRSVATICGFLYGIMLGPVLQCLLAGLIAYSCWQVGCKVGIARLARGIWGRGMVLFFWIGIEGAYLWSGVWSYPAFIAYSLAAALVRTPPPS